jgi:hypothetical protein
VFGWGAAWRGEVGIKSNKERFVRSSSGFCTCGKWRRKGSKGKGSEARDWRTHDRGE